jgi:hypothetical protein
MCHCDNVRLIIHVRLLHVSGHRSVNKRALLVNVRLEHELEHFCLEASLLLVGIYREASDCGMNLVPPVGN